jgi:ferredoxin
MATLSCGKVETDALKGGDVLGLLLDAGAQMNFICMSGSCGTCRVRVQAGMEHLAAPTPSEEMHLKGRLDQFRLACQATCLGTGDVTVSQP